jgi:hypothetical protein
MTMCANPIVGESEASVGRPSKLSQGNEPNNYLFEGGNPIVRVDPTGLAATQPATATSQPAGPVDVGLLPTAHWDSLGSVKK